METIDREQLKRMRDEDGDLTVVDVLGADSYEEAHLPGAINVPVGKGFEEKIETAVPDKTKPVVVYCANEECQASPKAARVMDRLGYEKVYDYEAGKEDWQRAGLPVATGKEPG